MAMGLLGRLFGGRKPSKRELLQARRTARNVARTIDAMPESPDLTSEERRVLEQTLPAIEDVARILGSDSDAVFMKAVVLGKLGRLEEAVRHARDTYAKVPSWKTAVMVANALRRSGDDRGAVEYFTVATGLDREDVTAFLEIGDTHVRLKRWVDALAAYEAALKREPDQPWALPSALYCRFRVTGQSAWIDQLRRLAEQPFDECGVASLLAQVTGGYAPDHAKLRAEQLLSQIET
jgi:tetratricopeptide (TPR) repeat protein